MAQEIADSKLLDTWSSSGTKIEPDISKIIEGWQLGEQPPHEYMNWLQNTFGSKLNHILKNGIPKWDSETEYLVGASTQHNGSIWLSKITNTNSEPTDSNNNWDKISSLENLALTVDTINDFPASATTGDTCIVKDLDRGGIFIYDSTKVAESNNGTNFNGWIRQCSGIVNVKWFGAKGDFTTDDSQAFIDMINALENFKNGSGPLANQLAGLKIVIPYGTYTIKQQISFDTLVHFTIEGNMAEIYYDGVALADDEYAVAFNLLSWVKINSLYFYCKVKFNSCYRLDIQNIKVQSDCLFNDLWNFNAISCWLYYSKLTIIGGHSHVYTSCAFEFGTDGVTIQNPDTYTFIGCYTESIRKTFKIIVDDTYNLFKQLTFSKCFFDVYYQSSPNYIANQPFMKFIDNRTVKTPIETVVNIDNCEFHSSGIQPTSGAVGCLVTADDTFRDIRITNSNSFWANTSITLEELGDTDRDYPDKRERLTKGVGIYVDEFNVQTADPLKNGDFGYAILQKSAIDVSDVYRENNLGWWGENSAGTGDASFGANGNGRVQLNSNSSMLIHIPVSGTFDILNKLARNYNYFFNIKSYYNTANITINAVRGTGASKVVGESLILPNYPTATDSNSSYTSSTTTAFNIPSDSTITYIQIKIASTNFTSIDSVKIRKARSNPVNWYPTRSSY